MCQGHRLRPIAEQVGRNGEDVAFEGVAVVPVGVVQQPYEHFLSEVFGLVAFFYAFQEIGELGAAKRAVELELGVLPCFGRLLLLRAGVHAIFHSGWKDTRGATNVDTVRANSVTWRTPRRGERQCPSSRVASAGRRN